MTQPARWRGALDGVRVAEIGGSLASRLLARLLTDQGAAVSCLRLAGEAEADPRQRWDDGVTATQVPAAGLAALLAQTDVLVDASGGGRAGLSAGELAALAPGLIVCRIPSFPSRAGKPAGCQVQPEPDGDWAVAAALGLDRMAAAEPAAEPLPVASAYAAALAGIYITAGLLRRDAGAGGMEMEVSLLGAGVTVLDRRLVDVADPACADPLGQWRLPIAERYECADGRYLQCQGATPGVAAAVLAALGHPEWTAEALGGITALPSAQDEARWRERFAAAFRQRTAAEWEERIAAHGGAGAVCRTRQEWLEEPHAAAAQIVLPAEPGGRRRPGPAVRVLPAPGQQAGQAAAATAAAPGRGEGSAAAGVPAGGQAPLPLAGTRVVDLSIILAGPTCGRLLAELGADVVKVDPPGRAVIPYVSPWGWLDVNRSKRSVLLDLRQPAARDALWQLIEDADVLVENFRAGKLEALGFGPGAVFARNPRIVYTSLNAYDFGGGFTRRAGWEQNAQAVSGQQLSRSPDGLPRQVPVPVNDYGTGLLGAFGTLMAVRSARQSGQGRRVLGSLARTASFLQLPDMFWDARGDGPVHLPGTIDFIRCTDGWVAALRPGSADGPATGHQGQDCASALASLRQAGVSCLRAASLAELRSGPQLREYGYLKTWQHPAWGEMTNVFASGFSSGFRQRDGWPAPDPGADGEQILASLGYGTDKIAAMRASGALGEPAPLFGEATSLRRCVS